MKLTCFQTRPRLLDRSHNLAEIEQLCQSVRSDLLVFPELATSGYRFRSKMEVKKVAEPFHNGPTGILLQKYARARKSVIVVGFPENYQGRLYNSALLVTPDNISVYRKIHLFGHEKKWFSPGSKPPPVVDSKGVKIGVMICFDWFFPEMARHLCLKGADIIAHPSNLVMPYAPAGMRTRSLENHVFTATVNRVGVERGLRFIGQTQVLDTKGRVLGKLGGKRTGMLNLTINPQVARNKWLTAENHIFLDRRRSLYLI